MEIKGGLDFGVVTLELSSGVIFYTFRWADTRPPLKRSTNVSPAREFMFGLWENSVGSQLLELTTEGGTS